MSEETWRPSAEPWEVLREASDRSRWVDLDDVAAQAAAEALSGMGWRLIPGARLRGLEERLRKAERNRDGLWVGEHKQRNRAIGAEARVRELEADLRVANRQWEVWRRRHGESEAELVAQRGIVEALKADNERLREDLEAEETAHGRAVELLAECRCGEEYMTDRAFVEAFERARRRVEEGHDSPVSVPVPDGSISVPRDLLRLVLDRAGEEDWAGDEFEAWEELSDLLDAPVPVPEGDGDELHELRERNRYLEQRDERKWGKIVALREAVAAHAAVLDAMAAGRGDGRTRDEIDNALYNAVRSVDSVWWDERVPGLLSPVPESDAKDALKGKIAALNAPDEWNDDQKYGWQEAIEEVYHLVYWSPSPVLEEPEGGKAELAYTAAFWIRLALKTCPITAEGREKAEKAASWLESIAGREADPLPGAAVLPGQTYECLENNHFGGTEFTVRESDGVTANGVAHGEVRVFETADLLDPSRWRLVFPAPVPVEGPERNAIGELAAAHGLGPVNPAGEEK